MSNTVQALYRSKGPPTFSVYSPFFLIPCPSPCLSLSPLPAFSASDHRNLVLPQHFLLTSFFATYDPLSASSLPYTSLAICRGRQQTASALPLHTSHHIVDAWQLLHSSARPARSFVCFVPPLASASHSTIPLFAIGRCCLLFKSILVFTFAFGDHHRLCNRSCSNRSRTATLVWLQLQSPRQDSFILLLPLRSLLSV